MKTCNVYKTDKSYIVVTESTSDIGLGIIDDPIYTLPLDVSIDEFQKKLFECLSKSKTGISTPKKNDWASWEKDHLLKMGQRSFATLYKNSNSCQVSLDGNVLIISPYKYYDPNRPKDGLCLVKEAEIKIDFSSVVKTEIIIKLIEMLCVSYK
ncbi:contact-dependent growth inhibition system immunity protein [Flavobacterium geliluteum]|uniref:CdiI family contact-dependent growth inhibition immunity protein n=1 Tax=Flavobacterium geliluteum TaxID=2816120 RepID=A0A940XB14_9FLAO|nr:contact-dependent growth inhibition system immunity protein [Flavobacterium geliluteum]MBP4140041.1 CdiI family contact-dependent growth inhibition immunity protein [Flavobacterium geliluteum]